MHVSGGISLSSLLIHVATSSWCVLYSMCNRASRLLCCSDFHLSVSSMESRMIIHSYWKWLNGKLITKHVLTGFVNESLRQQITLTWPTVQQRRLKTKLIMFYKIVHHIVAVPTTILIPTDPRIRQFHPFIYRHLHAFKEPYKYSFFPNTIIHWNLLPQTIVLCPTVNTFREQLTPTVLSHLQSQI